jgi:serine/threonine protein kinase/WD40 repeat protein
MSESLLQEDLSLESLLGQVADEFLRRQEQGERPDIEEYAARYPQAAPVLRKVLAALGLLERSATGAPVSLGSVPESMLTGMLGDFRILQEIGRGGMGIVYQAEQISLGRRVALKVLPFAATLDPKQLQRFKNEAQAAAHLHHTNIVPVFGVGCERGVHYYAMQFIEGQTLAAIIRELRRNVEGRMSNDERMPNAECRMPNDAPPEADPRTNVRHSTLDLLSSLGSSHSSFFRTAAHLGVQAAEALEHAHAKGIIHRDIKPANLLVDVSGNLWITDFGLARIVNEAGLTMTGDLVGTLRYMSPEQALAKRATMDARTDVYSLGATLYELLTLEPPYNGRDREELLRQIAFDEPRLPSRLNKAVPVDLQTIVLKAMAKSPEERYATAGELADDLRRFIAGEPVRARPATAWERGVKWARRRPAVAALIAVSVVAFLSIFAGTLWHNAKLSGALRKADTNLYNSRLNEVRAIRRARDDGYRTKVFDLLKEAMELETPEKDYSVLRQEAAACLGDFVGLEPTSWEEFPASIGCAALHPDGQLLALSFFDGTIELRPIPHGTPVRLRGLSSWAAALAFRAGGKELVAVDQTGMILIWRLKRDRTWTCSQKFRMERTAPLLMPLPALPFFTTTEVSSVDFPRLACFASAALTPDGRYLAASWTNSAVALVRIADGTAAGQFPVPNGEAIKTLTVSPDGKLLAAAYEHGGRYGIFVWDIRTRARQTLIPDLETPYCLAFSPDSKFMVCTHDEGVALYDTNTFQLRPFERGDLPSAAAFSPDSQILAYEANNIRLIRLWDISRNRSPAAVRCRHAFWVAFSKDSKILVAVSTELVRIWNLAGADEKLDLPGHAAGINSVVFSPDGKLLATSGGDHKVKIWNPTTCRLVKQLDFSTPVEGLCFSPEGDVLAAGDYDHGTIRFYDVDSWQTLGVMQSCVGDRVHSTAFSPRGFYFAAAGPLGLRLWRIVHAGGDRATKRAISFEPVDQLTEEWSSSICFSPDDLWLAWTDQDRNELVHRVNVWELGTLRPHALPMVPMAKSCRAGHALGFSDSKHLTFINDKLQVAVWDVTTKQEVASFGELAEKNYPRPKTHLSADGAWYAVADQTIRIWDMGAKKLLVALAPERSSVSSVNWSPDRKLLAVGGNDGCLEIWDLPKINAKLAKTGLEW